MNTPIDVIYQAYGAEGYQAHIRRFFDSYKANIPSAPHQLIIAATAYRDNPSGYEELKRLARESNATIMDLPDGGHEFGAFYRAAERLTADFIFCFVTSGRIVKPNWLDVFISATRENPQYGLIGSSGSWETTQHIGVVLKGIFNSKKPAFPALLETINTTAQRNRSLTRIIMKVFNATFRPVRFPNPHIRTNGFLIERHLYIRYINKYGIPCIRDDAHSIEHGRNHLSKFVQKSGFGIGVVGANGILYAPHEWDRSATFRCPDTSNAVILDKQHDFYAEAETPVKRHFEKLAWGHAMKDF
ncbi:MAG: hypothetical protein FWG50_06300 [Kiritimatiellaeota bacterium]|nr:hypothetical protein [Kiritimatiellota bacterium]